MTTVAQRHGHSAGYKVGCELCRAEAASKKRQQRARTRALQPVPPAVDNPDMPVAVGPVVAAVEADIAGLGDVAAGFRVLAAAAVAMARILDSGRNVPTWPAAAKQLGSLMDTLRREAAPRRGRLAAVQAMSRSSRPAADASLLT